MSQLTFSTLSFQYKLKLLLFSALRHFALFFRPLSSDHRINLCKGHERHAVRLLSFPAPSSSIMARGLAPICRRPALLAQSLGVVGKSQSFVRIARPTTTTDADNVGSFGLKEMNERRTKSKGGRRCRLHPANGVRPHRRGLRRRPRLVRQVSALSISFSDYLSNSLD